MRLTFFLCLTISISLLVAGFLIPPQGVIDGSVLIGCSLLFAYATLAVTAQAIKEGRIARLEKGDLKIEIGDEEDDDIVARPRIDRMCN